MSMKIVQFENGKYGLRRADLNNDIKYLDFKTTLGVYWWDLCKYPNFTADCQTATISEAVAGMQRINSPPVPAPPTVVNATEVPEEQIPKLIMLEKLAGKDQ